MLIGFVASPSQTEMYPITTSDKAFFESIRNAILANDVEWLSIAVSYPIVLRSSKGEFKLENKGDLKARFTLIATPRVKSVVRNESPASLFKNWQGVMVGNGEIWFSEIAQTDEQGHQRWVQKIVALNIGGS